MNRLALVALFVGVGFALGLFSVVSLRKNVELYATLRSRRSAVALHVARLAITIGVFVLLAKLAGALGLLSAFAGHLLARFIAVRRLRGAP